MFTNTELLLILWLLPSLVTMLLFLQFERYTNNNLEDIRVGDLVIYVLIAIGYPVGLSALAVFYIAESSHKIRLFKILFKERQWRRIE